MKKEYFYLILILTAGAILRLMSLFQRGSLWLDEIFSLHFSDYGLKNLFSFLLYETNPPLHIFFLHFWIKLFGSHALSIRSFSLILSLLSIILIYVLGKKIFSKKIGLMAASLMAISPFQIFYAAEARMYPLLLFFSLLSFYFFLLLKKKKLVWLGYFLSSLFLLYTHLTALFVLMIQNVWMIKKKEISLKKWFFFQFFLFFFFSVWFIPSFLSKIDGSFFQAWYFGEISPFFFIKIIQEFFLFSYDFPLISLLVQMIILFLFFLAFFRKEKREIIWQKNQTNIFLLLWLFLPLVFGFLFQVGIAKYFIISSPALYLLLSSGFEKLNFKTKENIFAFFFLFILFLPSYNEIFKPLFFWDKAAQWIAQKEEKGDQILVNPFSEALSLKHYYQGNLTITGLYFLSDQDSFDLRIVKHNWQRIVNEESIKKMEEYTRNYQRIFLVSMDQNISQKDLVKKWFLKNNWNLIEEKFFFSSRNSDIGNPNIFLFKKI